MRLRGNIARRLSRRLHCLLFDRIGDFYELFAVGGSRCHRRPLM
jgi:hypothetical protein